MGRTRSPFPNAFREAGLPAFPVRELPPARAFVPCDVAMCSASQSRGTRPGTQGLSKNFSVHRISTEPPPLSPGDRGCPPRCPPLNAQARRERHASRGATEPAAVPGPWASVRPGGDPVPAWWGRAAAPAPGGGRGRPATARWSRGARVALTRGRSCSRSTPSGLADAVRRRSPARRTGWRRRLSRTSGCCSSGLWQLEQRVVGAGRYCREGVGRDGR